MHNFGAGSAAQITQSPGRRQVHITFQHPRKTDRTCIAAIVAGFDGDFQPLQRLRVVLAKDRRVAHGDNEGTTLRSHVVSPDAIRRQVNGRFVRLGIHLPPGDPVDEAQARALGDPGAAGLYAMECDEDAVAVGIGVHDVGHRLRTGQADHIGAVCRRRAHGTDVVAGYYGACRCCLNVTLVDVAFALRSQAKAMPMTEATTCLQHDAFGVLRQVRSPEAHGTETEGHIRLRRRGDHEREVMRLAHFDGCRHPVLDPPATSGLVQANLHFVTSTRLQA